MCSLFLYELINPVQFKIAPPITDINPNLEENQGWDDYWRKKQTIDQFIYEVVALIYRTTFIKGQLNRYIRKHFIKGSKLLHAGCGSGQVDIEINREMNITGLDISVPALQLYKKFNSVNCMVKHGSLRNLPFPDETFDGVYNLGVLEHFNESDIDIILREFYRVLRPGGKFVVFWPHSKAPSVFVLNFIHWILNNAFKRNVRLHPSEISLLKSKTQAGDFVKKAGFELVDYYYGYKDICIQAVVVGKRPV
jgi:ubiquinone/menaquinone biosynthesis C-methylase UbiE